MCSKQPDSMPTPDASTDTDVSDAFISDAPVTGAVFLFCAMLPLVLLGGCSTGGNPPENSSNEAMFRADVQRTGVFPPGGPTTIDGAAWSFETNAEVWSSPAVSGGTVYVGSSDGSLYAVE